MNIIFVIHQAKIYLGSGLFSFYQGMVRTMKRSFYKRKYYLKSVPLCLLRKKLQVLY